MARPAGLLEIGQIRRAHGVRGDVLVELASDRSERVAPGARWFAADGWLTVVSARRHQDRWLVTLAELGDRSAAQQFTNTAVFAEPIDDPEELWVHELIGSEVVELSGRSRGTCVAVIANPAADLLELDSGALVPVVFVTERRDGTIVIDPPVGLFDDVEGEA
ncbi:MAG TPA: ribosome maturation factor RimM [Desertimonas sp.]|nr:ribosome maturation factor RimM [Desertimonas sp.]